ncbi:MAG: ABC transporter permease [Candidatus Saccharibacteria bacterium]
MKLRDIAIRAGRSLKQAKARTLLTSLAIGVGAFTITLSLAAGVGGRAYTDQIVNANTNVKELSVTKKPPAAQQGPQKYTGVAAVSSSSFFSGQELTQDDIDKILKVDGVVSVSPNYSPQIKYITRTDQEKYVATISTFSPSVTLKFAAGSVSGDLADNEIILTEEYVTALGFSSNADAVGKTVEIVADKLSSPVTAPESNTFIYTVKGVSSKSGLAFRAQSSLLISNASAKTLYDYINIGTRSYGNYLVASVETASASQATKVKDDLTSMGYLAQTAADVLGVINTFINVLQGILLGFGALAVLTSVFGIINTQYISVLERTQQIGLMKALGMRRRDVGRLFKLEAAWIGLLGGSIGTGLAVILGVIANPIISKSLDIGDVSLIVFTPMNIAIVIIGLVFVSVSSGILPARKAAKLNPIEALRTE